MSGARKRQQPRRYDGSLHLLNKEQKNEVGFTSPKQAHENVALAKWDSLWWPVEKISEKKTTKEGVFYLVKWEGYDDENNRWIPSSQLRCDELIKQFEIFDRKQKQKLQEIRDTKSNSNKNNDKTKNRNNNNDNDDGNDDDDDDPSKNNNRSLRNRVKKNDPVDIDEDDDVVENIRGRRSSNVNNNKKKKINEDKEDKEDEEEGEEEFEVEKIVGKQIMFKRKNEMNIKYFVKWKGWDTKWNSWVDMEDLNCPLLVEEFEKHHLWLAGLDRKFTLNSVSSVKVENKD